MKTTTNPDSKNIYRYKYGQMLPPPYGSPNKNVFQIASTKYGNGSNSSRNFILTQPPEGDPELMGGKF